MAQVGGRTRSLHEGGCFGVACAGPSSPGAPAASIRLGPRSCRRRQRHRANQPTHWPPRQPMASHPTRAAAARPRDRRSRAPWPARDCGWPGQPVWLAPTVLPRPRHPGWPHPAWRGEQYAWARHPVWPASRQEYCSAAARTAGPGRQPAWLAIYGRWPYTYALFLAFFALLRVNQRKMRPHLSSTA